MRKLFFVLGIVIFTIGFGSKAISKALTVPVRNHYAPSRLGIPDTIGPYAVLAVLTNDNFPCMRPGEKRLIFQSREPTIQNALLVFSKQRIIEDLHAVNLAEYAQWGLDIVGPGVTQEWLASQLAQSYRFFKVHDCIRLRRYAAPAGGEQKHAPPYQGYAVIQDVDAGNYTDDNAQSVYLVAPTVGNNQQRYSGILNNVLTNTDYFLQAGFDFSGKEGIVVWTDDAYKLVAQPFPIPYYADHMYGTLISFTNGVWWMCALDNQNRDTYNCHGEPKATGTNMKKDVNTAIFAENWNENALWYDGFSNQWIALAAQIYRNGVAQDWSSQDTWTYDSCTDEWRPEDAIGGSLVGGGIAYFNVVELPVYCK